MGEFKPIEHRTQFIPQSLSHVGARRGLESQALRIPIQRDLLLGYLAERLDPWQEPTTRIPEDRIEPSEPLDIALEQIQQVGLHDIVQVVSRGDLCGSDPLGSYVDRLSSEDTAIGTSSQPFRPPSLQKIV